MMVSEQKECFCVRGAVAAGTASGDDGKVGPSLLVQYKRDKIFGLLAVIQLTVISSLKTTYNSHARTSCQF